MVRDRLPLEIHINQNIVTMPNQYTGVNISIDLRILGKPGIDDVFSREFRFVFIESICYKHRNVVAPSVSRRCGQQNPIVFSRNIKEGFHPGPRPNDTLFIEYKERSVDVLILLNVIPAIDNNLVIVYRYFWIRSHQKWGQFVFPFFCVSLSCSCDDIQIARVLHLDIVFGPELTTLLLVVICK